MSDERYRVFRNSQGLPYPGDTRFTALYADRDAVLSWDLELTKVQALQLCIAITETILLAGVFSATKRYIELHKTNLQTILKATGEEIDG